MNCQTGIFPVNSSDFKSLNQKHIKKAFSHDFMTFVIKIGQNKYVEGHVN